VREKRPLYSFRRTLTSVRPGTVAGLPIGGSRSRSAAARPARHETGSAGPWPSICRPRWCATRCGWPAPRGGHAAANTRSGTDRDRALARRDLQPTAPALGHRRAEPRRLRGAILGSTGVGAL